jgi:hypothetical protein
LDRTTRFIAEIKGLTTRNQQSAPQTNVGKKTESGCEYILAEIIGILQSKSGATHTGHAGTRRTLTHERQTRSSNP